MLIHRNAKISRPIKRKADKIFISVLFLTTNEFAYLCTTEKEKSFSRRNFNRKS